MLSFDAIEQTPRRTAAPRVLAALLATLLATALVCAAGVAPVLGLAAAGTVSVTSYWNDLPTDLPTDTPLAQQIRLLDKNGHQFAQFFDTDRVVLRLNQISPNVSNALLATEDTRFYQHHGVDLRGTLRALVHDSSGTGSVQGGSTLTQQLVKNIRQENGDSDGLNGRLTTENKIQDARYALALEQKLSKNDILDRYLNTVFFGSGAYGIGAAAQHYFNTAAARLTVAQAATLVGLVQSPVAYDPIAHPDTKPLSAPSPAHLRRNVVLQRMVAYGKLDQKTADQLSSQPLKTHAAVEDNGCAQSSYPFYCEHVREDILSEPAFGATVEARQQTLLRGGLTITTALDPVAQDAANAAELAALPVTNRVATASATVTPGTGLITAIAENRDWGTDASKGQSEIVLADTPNEQPGSSFKAFTLATALEGGLNPRAKRPAPAAIAPPNVDLPLPDHLFHNDDFANHGKIDAYAATGGSVNTWFVGLIAQIGVLKVADLAAQLGIDLPRTGDHAVTPRAASLTLGTFDVSPMEMAGAYAAFASSGIYCTPTAITGVKQTTTGKALTAPDPSCHRVLTPYVADTVTDVLHAPLGKGGTAAGLGIAGQDSVGKTGTTTGGAALWFVGSTAQDTTAVWVGDPRGGPKYPLDYVDAYGRSYYGPIFGATIAAPIWHDTMTTLLTGVAKVPFPKPVPGPLTVPVATVPSVLGLSESAAKQVLTADGYAVTISGSTSTDPLLPTGTVSTQFPPAGAGQEKGGVTLTLTGSN